MALLSGLEILFAAAIVGILILVGVRSRRERGGFNFLPYVVVGALLLVILALSRTTVSLAKLVLALSVIVLVLVGLVAYRSAKSGVS
jgi:predicted membrane channel-forming protein YqfA (hemolysin III family)